MPKEQNITKKQETALDVAGMASEFAGSVTVRQELIKIPRLKLTQNMSDAATDGVAKPGDFSCTVLTQNYGKEVKIIPLMVSESASLLYSVQNPPSKGVEDGSFRDGEIVCRSMDMVKNINGISCSSCPFDEFHSDWGSRSDPKIPKCRASIDVVCLLPEHSMEQPMVLSFRKTSYKAGKSLVNYIFNEPKKVPFASTYTLKAEQATKDNYKYFVISPAMERSETTDKELGEVIPVAKMILEAQKKGQVQHEMEDDLPI